MVGRGGDKMTCENKKSMKSEKNTESGRECKVGK